ncbi:MAG: thioredoxin family protein [Blastocatellia bacterium]
MKEYLDKAMTFAEYINLIDGLLAEGKTTGPKQSEAMFNYGKLNRQRMHRLEKTVELSEAVKSAAKNTNRKQIWLIITEGWCGDAAQNLPVIEKIAAESVNIETRYVLRDENLELMDRFLTAGARSIPKLIALDAETLEVLGTWGARPEAAQNMFIEMKQRGLEKPLIMENLQRWYNEDHGRSVQSEFDVLLRFWDEREISAAETASA